MSHSLKCFTTLYSYKTFMKIVSSKKIFRYNKIENYFLKTQSLAYCFDDKIMNTKKYTKKTVIDKHD